MGGASAPPFFRHFPFKIGDLEAHPGKIRGRQRKIRGRQRKIWGRERKTMRQIGKIGRRKVFSEVKNVNVKSLKNGSKLLDFWSSTQEWRGASPPIAISCFTFVTFVTFVSFVTFVTNVTYDSLRSLRLHRSRDSFHSRSKFHSRDSCSKTKCRVCEVFKRSHVELVFHVFRTLHEEMRGRTLAWAGKVFREEMGRIIGEEEFLKKTGCKWREEILFYYFCAEVFWKLLF